MLIEQEIIGNRKNNVKENFDGVDRDYFPDTPQLETDSQQKEKKIINSKPKVIDFTGGDDMYNTDETYISKEGIKQAENFGTIIIENAKKGWNKQEARNLKARQRALDAYQKDEDGNFYLLDEETGEKNYLPFVNKEYLDQNQKLLDLDKEDLRLIEEKSDILIEETINKYDGNSKVAMQAFNFLGGGVTQSFTDPRNLIANIIINQQAYGIGKYLFTKTGSAIYAKLGQIGADAIVSAIDNVMDEEGYYKYLYDKEFTWEDRIKMGGQGALVGVTFGLLSNGKGFTLENAYKEFGMKTNPMDRATESMANTMDSYIAELKHSAQKVDILNNKIKGLSQPESNVKLESSITRTKTEIAYETSVEKKAVDRIIKKIENKSKSNGAYEYKDLGKIIPEQQMTVDIDVSLKNLNEARIEGKIDTDTYVDGVKQVAREAFILDQIKQDYAKDINTKYNAQPGDYARYTEIRNKGINKFAEQKGIFEKEVRMEWEEHSATKKMNNKLDKEISTGKITVEQAEMQKRNAYQRYYANKVDSVIDKIDVNKMTPEEIFAETKIRKINQKTSINKVDTIIDNSNSIRRYELINDVDMSHNEYIHYTLGAEHKTGDYSTIMFKDGSYGEFLQGSDGLSIIFRDENEIINSVYKVDKSGETIKRYTNASMTDQIKQIQSEKIAFNIVDRLSNVALEYERRVNLGNANEKTGTIALDEATQQELYVLIGKMKLESEQQYLVLNTAMQAAYGVNLKDITANPYIAKDVINTPIIKSLLLNYEGASDVLRGLYTDVDGNIVNINSSKILKKVGEKDIQVDFKLGSFEAMSEDDLAMIVAVNGVDNLYQVASELTGDDINTMRLVAADIPIEQVNATVISKMFPQEILNEISFTEIKGDFGNVVGVSTDELIKTVMRLYNDPEKRKLLNIKSQHNIWSDIIGTQTEQHQSLRTFTLKDYVGRRIKEEKVPVSFLNEVAKEAFGNDIAIFENIKAEFSVDAEINNTAKASRKLFHKGKKQPLDADALVKKVQSKNFTNKDWSALEHLASNKVIDGFEISELEAVRLLKEEGKVTNELNNYITRTQGLTNGKVDTDIDLDTLNKIKIWENAQYLLDKDLNPKEFLDDISVDDMLAVHPTANKRRIEALKNWKSGDDIPRVMKNYLKEIVDNEPKVKSITSKQMELKIERLENIFRNPKKELKNVNRLESIQKWFKDRGVKIPKQLQELIVEYKNKYNIAQEFFDMTPEKNMALHTYLDKKWGLDETNSCRATAKYINKQKAIDFMTEFLDPDGIESLTFGKFNKDKTGVSGLYTYGKDVVNSSTKINDYLNYLQEKYPGKYESLVSLYDTTKDLFDDKYRPENVGELLNLMSDMREDINRSTSKYFSDRTFTVSYQGLHKLGRYFKDAETFKDFIFDVGHKGGFLANTQMSTKLIHDAVLYRAETKALGGANLRSLTKALREVGDSDYPLLFAQRYFQENDLGKMLYDIKDLDQARRTASIYFSMQITTEIDNVIKEKFNGLAETEIKKLQDKIFNVVESDKNLLVRVNSENNGLTNGTYKTNKTKKINAILNKVTLDEELSNISPLILSNIDKIVDKVSNLENNFDYSQVYRTTRLNKQSEIINGLSKKLVNYKQQMIADSGDIIADRFLDKLNRWTNSIMMSGAGTAEFAFRGFSDQLQQGGWYNAWGNYKHLLKKTGKAITQLPLVLKGNTVQAIKSGVGIVFKSSQTVAEMLEKTAFKGSYDNIDFSIKNPSKYEMFKNGISKYNAYDSINEMALTMFYKENKPEVYNRLEAMSTIKHITKAKNGAYGTVLLDQMQQFIENQKAIDVVAHFEEFMRTSDNFSKGRNSIGDKRWSFFRSVGMSEEQIKNYSNILKRLKAEPDGMGLTKFMSLTELELYKRGFNVNDTMQILEYQNMMGDLVVETQDIYRKKFGKQIVSADLSENIIKRFSTTISSVVGNIINTSTRFYGMNGERMRFGEMWNTYGSGYATKQVFNRFAYATMAAPVAVGTSMIADYISVNDKNDEKRKMQSEMNARMVLFSDWTSWNGNMDRLSAMGNSMLSAFSNTTGIGFEDTNSPMSSLLTLPKVLIKPLVYGYDKYTGANKNIAIDKQFEDDSIGKIKKYTYGNVDNYLEYTNAGFYEITKRSFLETFVNKLRTDSLFGEYFDPINYNLKRNDMLLNGQQYYLDELNKYKGSLKAQGIISKGAKEGARLNYSTLELISDHIGDLKFNSLVDEYGQVYKDAVQKYASELHLIDDFKISEENKKEYDTKTLKDFDNLIKNTSAEFALGIAREDRGNLKNLSKEEFKEYYEQAQEFIKDIFYAESEYTAKSQVFNAANNILEHIDINYKLGLIEEKELEKMFDNSLGIKETNEMYDEIFDDESQEWLEKNIIGVVGGNPLFTKARINLVASLLENSGEEITLNKIKEKLGIHPDEIAVPLNEGAVKEYMNYFQEHGVNVTPAQLQYLAYNEITPDEMIEARQQFKQAYGGLFEPVEKARSLEDVLTDNMLETLSGLGYDELDTTELQNSVNNYQDIDIEDEYKEIQNINISKTPDILSKVGNLMGLKEKVSDDYTPIIKNDDGVPLITNENIIQSMADNNEFTLHMQDSTKDKDAKDILIKAMPYLKQYGVDPALFLSQWSLESGWGTDEMKGENNLFNVMKSKDWDIMNTTKRIVPEYNKKTGQWENKVQYFKNYNSHEESIEDYVKLIAEKYMTNGEVDLRKLENFGTHPEYAQRVNSQIKVFQDRLVPVIERIQDNYREQYESPKYNQEPLIRYANEKKIKNFTGEEGEEQLDPNIVLSLIVGSAGQESDIVEALTNKKIHPIPARMMREMIINNPKLGDSRIKQYHEFVGLNDDIDLSNVSYCASAISFFGDDYLDKKSALSSALYKDNGKVVKQGEPLKTGDICFYYSKSKGRIGHCNVVLDILEDGTILTIGANQSSEHKFTIRAYNREQIKYAKRLRGE